jgi:hypothetical protein
LLTQAGLDETFGFEGDITDGGCTVRHFLFFSADAQPGSGVFRSSFPVAVFFYV